MPQSKKVTTLFLYLYHNNQSPITLKLDAFIYRSDKTYFKCNKSISLDVIHSILQPHKSVTSMYDFYIKNLLRNSMQD